ncbi:hypothetical protein AAFN85_14385 [Mucilaginibacter sp. CAU 1740]|uniref:hypothetical protein n=1 Tax=Mucilaginibacter sp. CAU 1740 TaxID=3140365 RepID=UPI00325AD6A1
MNRKLFLLLLALLAGAQFAFAQKKDLREIESKIENEGKALYRSEWASWYGSDIFIAKCKDKQPLSGGFISYETPNGRNNVFYTREESPKVLATISFGADFNKDNYQLDTTSRAFTPAERELYELKHAAQIRMTKDTTFKVYKNSALNPVPLIHNGVKKVYVLTGPQVNGVVLFGNDYLLDLDKNNNVTKVSKLHKSLIPAYFTNTTGDSTKNQAAAMHSHLPEYDEFMTVTDICTLMLYEKFTTWNQCMVISKDYISIWDCKKDSLLILTTEAWKKITNDHEQRTKKE